MSFVLELVGGLIGGLIAEAFIGSSRSRAAKRGVFLGGLRVMSGHHSGLSSEWLVGEWLVQPGRLQLGNTVISITERVHGARRTAKRSELVGAGDTVVLIVRTQTAELEWSLLRRFDSLALTALNVPDAKPIA